MTGFLRDAMFGLRMLAKSPTVTLVAVVTLGLGIGAITAIFSVVNAVLLRPLPFAKPAELVRFYTQFPTMKFDKFWLSPPEYNDLSRDARSFRAVAAYQPGGAALVVNDRPMRVALAQATHTFAATLGVPPAMGRWFAAYDDLPGDPHVAVLSDRLWRSAFAADPEIVGRHIRVAGNAVTVVGVMPPGFGFPDADTELWLPLGLDPASIARGNHRLSVIGRLGEGVTIGGARGEIAGLMTGWKDAGHHHFLGPPNHPLVVWSLKDEMVGPVRSILWLLQAAVLFVLLIACANVSNLLLARAEARSREIAIRNALGANRGRLVRQFLTESVLLGVLGAGLGLALAVWGVDMTVSLLPKGAPRASEIHVDVWVLGFAAVTGLLTSLLFGLAPILHTRVDDLGAVLKEGQRSTGSPRQRFRRTLVVSEIALAMILVIGCGLVIKSFVRLQNVDPGFRPEGLVAGRIQLDDKTYPKPEDVMVFWQRFEAEMRAAPGIASATLLGGLPPTRQVVANDAQFEGLTFNRDTISANIDFWQFCGDDFMATLGLRLVAGRFLGPGDTASSEPVVVVNETLARKFYPGQDPIGKRVKVAGWVDEAPWQRIVGVVADVKQQGLEAPTGTEAYVAVRQMRVITGDVERELYVAVRGVGVDNSIRTVVRSLDATLPVYELATLDRVMYEAVGKPRFIAFLLAVFAGLALLLAAVGIYGVISYAVAQRTRELGIRMALGAPAPAVRRLVMRDGLILATVGVVVGLGGAFALVGGLSSQIAGILYDVPAADPATFAAVTAVVLVVAALACFVPALRATRVDPMIALRHD